MKIDVKKIMLYIFVFYIIYTPAIPEIAFLDKNITIPIIAFVMFMLYVVTNKNIKVSKVKFIFILLILLSNLYCFIIYIINNEFNLKESRLIQNNLVICYLIILSVLFSILKKKDYSKEEIFNIIANLAIIQGIICIAMLIFPRLHHIALRLYMGDRDNIFITGARIYGISSDYTYATPIYHAFIASLLFYKYLLTNKISNIFKCIVILVTVFLNGRTGLLVFIILSLVYLFSYCIKKRKLRKLITTLILSISLMLILLNISKKYIPKTYEFVQGFIDDTISLIDDKEYTGNYAILKRSFYFPSGQNLIFGQGIRIYKANINKNLSYVQSDIGYVNDVFLGGIIYCILLYSSYIYIINKNIKNTTIRNGVYATIIISNFKGEMFRASILICLVLLICCLEEYDEKRIDNSNHTNI